MSMIWNSKSPRTEFRILDLEPTSDSKIPQHDSLETPSGKSELSLSTNVEFQKVPEHIPNLGVGNDLGFQDSTAHSVATHNYED